MLKKYFNKLEPMVNSKKLLRTNVDLYQLASYDDCSLTSHQNAYVIEQILCW